MSETAKQADQSADAGGEPATDTADPYRDGTDGILTTQVKRAGWATFRVVMLALSAAAMMPLLGALADWLLQAENLLAEHGAGLVDGATAALPQFH